MLDDAEESVSELHGELDIATTPFASSAAVQVKDEHVRGSIGTRTTSVATMQGLDISPAPSSTFTRRSDMSSRSEELRLRVLCHVNLVGAMIGRRGENIKRLQRNAHAELVIDDFICGSDERVMTVVLHREGNHYSASSAGDALVAVLDSFCALSRDSSTANNSSEETDTQTINSSDKDMEFKLSILDDEECEIRLLVDSSQIGFIVGKNGATIKATMEASGASVNIVSKAELPKCAWVSDEMIKVAGDRHAVSLALRILARQLEHHPPRSSYSTSKRPPLLLAHASSADLQFMSPPPSPQLHHHHQHHSQQQQQHMTPVQPHQYHQQQYHHHQQQQQQQQHSSPGISSGSVVDTVFRLLAPAARAGNIIGKNGDHVRRIRIETGARIKVYGGENEVEERLVCVSSTEDASSQYCAAQDALVRCAISLSGEDSASAGQHTLRLLSPQMSIGVVLGKRGQTVMQLRQETGAAIQVQPVEAPIAAAAAAALGGGEAGGDEIIQLSGTLQQCIAALRGVATLLRGWQIRRLVVAASSLHRPPPSPLQPMTTLTFSPQPQQPQPQMSMSPMYQHHFQPQLQPQPQPQQPVSVTMASPQLHSGGYITLHAPPQPPLQPQPLPQPLLQPLQPQQQQHHHYTLTSPGMNLTGVPMMQVSVPVAMMQMMSVMGAPSLSPSPSLGLSPSHSAGGGVLLDGGSPVGVGGGMLHTVHSSGGSGSGGGAPPLSSPSIYSSSSPDTGLMVWRYRLSNAQAGAVIGMCGQHIMAIRTTSHARVSLPGDQVVVDGMRVLEISGHMNACQIAHSMVNQYLAMAQCPPAAPEHQSGVAAVPPPPLYDDDGAAPSSLGDAGDGGAGDGVGGQSSSIVESPEVGSPKSPPHQFAQALPVTPPPLQSVNSQ